MKFIFIIIIINLVVYEARDVKRETPVNQSETNNFAAEVVRPNISTRIIMRAPLLGSGCGEGRKLDRRGICRRILS